MKKLGRRNRPFFRVCAIDWRAPRDGRVIEELGTYDPMVPETDARAILNRDRIAYWLSVGAQPSERVAVLIRKYGKDGSHIDAQQQALDRLASRRSDAIVGAAAQARQAAARRPKPAPPQPASEASAESPASNTAGDSATGESASDTASNPAIDAPASE
jgi:small subunit ribosomal protein S16